MSEFLFCLSGRVCQILGLVLLGYVFRVDRNQKGGKGVTDAK